MKKHFKAVELRHLDEETILKIREWRNQEFVRKSSYSRNVVSVEEHLNYINILKQDPNRGLFVFYLDDEPFGVYQYYLHPEGDYIMGGNYLISEEYQDMGYGLILTYFLNVIRFEKFGITYAYEETLGDNKRMLSMVRKIRKEPMTVTYQRELEDGMHDVYAYWSCADSWKSFWEKSEKIIFRIVEEQYEIII